MRDVAKVAGVSYRTVSRVVNEEKWVAEETAERVRRAVAELGFERNDLARSLRRSSATNTVGLLIEDMRNPFYGAFAFELEAQARAHDHVLITASGEHQEDREREVVSAFIRRRVDGLVMFPVTEDQGYLAGEAQRGTPLVFVDQPPHGVDADCVVVDNTGGAQTAVAHLLAHGHRRIGVVGEAESITVARERLLGYRNALTDVGVPHDDRLVVMGNRTTDDARTATRRLLELPAEVRPTALFAANNRNTVGALFALQDLRIDDVAVVGAGDFETAPLLRPGVTVVRHNPADLARTAAELLFARLAGHVPPEPRKVELPMQLVCRGSGEIRPGGKGGVAG